MDGHGHDQQQDIDNKQDHIAVIADTKHSSTYCSWDTCKCHDPAHNTGYADQENDDTCHFSTVQKNLCMMQNCAMFYNRKPQACTSGFT